LEANVGDGLFLVYMSNSIARVYSDAVKKNQKVLYGVGEPGFPVKLGDY